VVAMTVERKRNLFDELKQGLEQIKAHTAGK
jgi:hypothetical protein